MAFGDSGLVDQFNRADGALGTGWSTPAYQGDQAPRIVSNQAADNSDYSDALRTTPTSSADSEAFITISTLPANNSEIVYVMARAVNGNSSSYDAYMVTYTRQSGTDTLSIFRIDNGTDTLLGSAINQEVAAGDSIGIRCVGTTIAAWYRSGAGAWTEMGTRTDSTYSAAGSIGFGLQGTATRLDDFGGGNTVDGTFIQEGYRFRNDDGSETSATWEAAQDTNITQPASTTRRLRVLVDTTGDQATTQFRLDYRLSSLTTYVPVLTAAPSAPAFQAAGTAATGTGNVSPAWPTHQSGDIGLLLIESAGGEAANLGTAAGFAAVTNSPSSTGATTSGTRISVYWCRATSSSMATPTVTDPGDHVYAQIITFRGCVADGDPWNTTAAAQKASASTSASAPTVTTTVNNCLIVNIISRDDDNAAAAFSAWANASLTSVGEVTGTDAGTVSGNGGGFAMSTGVLAAAGASGTTTATVTSSINASLTIALRPEPTPFLMQTSSNITASGEATTAQLTAPSGKSTSDFVAGRMQDDENPADTVNITTDDYTELEWCIRSQSTVVNADVYQFRVTANGTALNTYSVTPQWTIGSTAVESDASSSGTATVAVTVGAVVYATTASSTGTATVAVSLSSAVESTASSTGTATVAVSLGAVVYASVASSTATATAAIVIGTVVYASVASSSGTATTAVAAVGTYSTSSGTDAGYALRFYGSNTADVDRVRIPLTSGGGSTATAVNVGSGNFTYELYLKCAKANNTSNSPEDWRFSNVAFDRDIWSDQRGHGLGVTQDGGVLVPVFGVAGASLNHVSIAGTSEIGDGAWHYIVVDRNASTGLIRLGVDGVWQDSGTYTTGSLAYPTSYTPSGGQDNEYIVLGQEKHDVEDDDGFNGTIGFVRISNARLYTDSTFTVPTTIQEPIASTVGLYTFNDGSGTTLNDYSGNNVDGALLVGGSNNGPTWGASDMPMSVTNATVSAVRGALQYLSIASSTATATVAVVLSTVLYNYQSTVAGTLTSSAALLKATSTAKAGALTFAGALTSIKVFLRDLSSALSFAGAVMKTAGKEAAGTLTSAGTMSKQTGKGLAGTLTSSGALSAARVILSNVAGALSFAGGMIKSTTKQTAGALSPTATLLKNIGKNIAGALGLVGAAEGVSGLVAYVGGVLGLAGAIAKSTSTAKSGALAPAGSTIKTTSRALAGALSPTAALTAAIVFLKLLVGSLNPAGALSRASAVARSGELVLIGSLNRLNFHSEGGVLGLAGNVAKTIPKTLAGVLGLVAAITTAMSEYLQTTTLTFESKPDTFTFREPT